MKLKIDNIDKIHSKCETKQIDEIDEIDNFNNADVKYVTNRD